MNLIAIEPPPRQRLVKLRSVRIVIEGKQQFLVF